MKLLISLGIGLMATYLALVFALGNPDVVASKACSPDFTLPALACRFANLGVMLLAAPFCGVVATIVAWIALPKTQRK